MKCLFLLFLLPLAAWSQPLVITPLTDSIWITTTYQKYGDELVPSNSMVMVTNDGVLIIDTPWDTTQIQPLIDSIDTHFHQPVVFCLATHFHNDRTGGFALMRRQNIATWSSDMTREYCQQRNEPLAEFTFEGDTTFTIGGTTFETYYPGAGHAPDNIVLWFPKQKILYGGCFVKSIENSSLGNIADADLKSWKKAVKKVKKRYKKPRHVIPGHYSWDSPEALQHTYDLLKNAPAQ